MPENSKQNYYKIALCYPLFTAQPFSSIAAKYRRIRGSVSALSAVAYTTTLLVMVDRVKGEGVDSPPPLTRVGRFYHHDGITVTFHVVDGTNVIKMVNI
jgi:hypothetical protein